MIGTEITRRNCPNCGLQKHERNVYYPNHVLHLLLTVLTLGLWVFCWIAIAVLPPKKDAWHCSVCGEAEEFETFGFGFFNPG